MNRDLKLFCKEMTRKSGEIIKQYFRSDLTIDLKSDATPVTVADKKAEEAMRELIMKEHPDHGILGEEFGEHNPQAEYQWILDPIDGTKTFIAGVPLFGTLICLLKKGQPVIGVIHNPILEQFLIGDNNSCFMNDTPAKVKPCSSIEEARLLTTDHYYLRQVQKGASFEELAQKVKFYRTWGDCYGYFLLATGYADIMIDPQMSKWDSLALIPVIRGAGGIISDFQGRDPVEHPDSTIAAAPGIHDKVVALLNPEE